MASCYALHQGDLFCLYISWHAYAFNLFFFCMFWPWCYLGIVVRLFCMIVRIGYCSIFFSWLLGLHAFLYEFSPTYRCMMSCILVYVLSLLFISKRGRSLHNLCLFVAWYECRFTLHIGCECRFTQHFCCMICIYLDCCICSEGISILVFHIDYVCLCATCGVRFFKLSSFLLKLSFFCFSLSFLFISCFSLSLFHSCYFVMSFSFFISHSFYNSYTFF